jgi:hypothetical protein
MENLSDIIKTAKKDPELLSTIHVDDLLDAIENSSIDYLENQTLKTISRSIFEALRSANVPEDKFERLYQELIGFRLVDKVCHLHKGMKVVKTLCIQNKEGEPVIPEKLIYRGIVMKTDFRDSGTYILTKNTNNHRVLYYHFDQHLTFQKLSSDEQMILTALEYIDKQEEHNDAV